MTRDELIHAMIGGYQTKEAHWVTPLGMAAALDVVLGEVLGDPTGDEKIAARYAYYVDKQDKDVEHALAECFASRRAHYSKVKTAEERVEVRELENGMHEVYEDGNYRGGWSERKLAEAMRIGLIQQLKEGK